MERTNSVKGKEITGIIICLACILYVTLFSRSPTLTRSVHLNPLGSYLSHAQTEQILLNIALFFPLGFFLASFFQGKRHPLLLALFTGLAVSTGIEAAQFLTYRGMLDVEDLVSNVLGTVVGILIWKAAQGITPHKVISWLMIVQYKFDNRGFQVPADQKAGNELDSIDHYGVFQREIPAEY